MTECNSRSTVRENPGRQRRAGMWGTLSRVVVGASLLSLAAWYGLPWYEVVVGLVALPAVAILAMALRGRNAPPLHFDGPGGHCFACALGAALFLGLHQGALLFYGASMLVVALRRGAGCEPFAISNWILQRDDQLACPLFGPVDAMEARIARRRTARSVRTSSRDATASDRGVIGS